MHCSLGLSKSHKCKCHDAALELLEFNSLNDVFIDSGCMAKIILLPYNYLLLLVCENLRCVSPSKLLGFLNLLQRLVGQIALPACDQKFLVTSRDKCSMKAVILLTSIEEKLLNQGDSKDWSRRC